MKEPVYVVTYYLDDNDALPCQEIMTAAEAMVLDGLNRVVKMEPLDEESTRLD